MSNFKEVYDENAIIAQLLMSLEEKDYKIALLKSELLKAYEREEELISRCEAEAETSPLSSTTSDGRLYVFDNHFKAPTPSLVSSIMVIHPSSSVKEPSMLSKFFKSFKNSTKSSKTSKAKKAKRFGKLKVSA